jgi:hypothetical protein
MATAIPGPAARPFGGPPPTQLTFLGGLGTVTDDHVVLVFPRAADPVRPHSWRRGPIGPSCWPHRLMTCSMAGASLKSRHFESRRYRAVPGLCSRRLRRGESP